MTLTANNHTISDSEALPDLPFAPPMPTVPVRAIVEVDLSDGVRYQQECGHRTWWAGQPDLTPKVGQLHSCIACWASLLDAESLLPAGATPVALPTHADPVTPADLLANFNDFRKWLATKAPTYIVGEAQTSAYCPIATYLHESGVQNPSVGQQECRWSVDPTERWEDRTPGTPLPDWAQRFVTLVDEQGACHPIRASLATTLLYEAVRDDR
jgi:hypothetical protein